jgi:hypothetical protein
LLDMKREDSTSDDEREEIIDAMMRTSSRVASPRDNDSDSEDDKDAIVQAMYAGKNGRASLRVCFFLFCVVL